MSDMPSPGPGQILLAHFVTSSDLAASTRFYTHVLGGSVSLEAEGGPTVIQLANTWIIINHPGGPTEDKPTVTLTLPQDPNVVDAFLNIRVGDIAAVYREWTAKGAQFLTEPIAFARELRCYLRDPDGHLIEVGQQV